MKVATREAYGKTLAALAKENKNIIVLDADLSGSTKTKEVKAVAVSYTHLDVYKRQPQGSLGRQPSLASLRTCSLLSLAHDAICAIIRSSSLIINALTANSADAYGVYLAKADIEMSQFSLSCP